MNTQEARHAMVNGKRVATRVGLSGIYWYCNGQAFVWHGADGRESMDATLPDRDDWYVVEDEKPKFRECEITRVSGIPCCKIGGRTSDVYELAVHPDFAGFLMPGKKKEVMGLFQRPDGPDGGLWMFVSRESLESGTFVPVDPTECKVLLRRRDDT